MSTSHSSCPTYPPGDSSDEEKGPTPLLSSPHFTLSWSNLSFKVPKRERPILENISGSVNSGELLAGESLYSFPSASSLRDLLLPS